MDQIPVVDISDLDSPEAARRREVAEQLGQACRSIGFLYVANHGISEGTLNAVFAAAKAFFDLPSAAKEEFPVIGMGSPDVRGYFAIEKERLDESAELSDYKEAFDVGLELAADEHDKLARRPFHSMNVWPALPGWREAVLDYYNACWALGRLIHRGFALNLGLDEAFFEDKLDEPLATLRLLHYPLQPGGRPQRPDSGAGTHTDYGNLTILATDGVAGLQVRTRAGDWMEAPHIPGTFVCNIGDCLMRWTNDVYVSTPHRVAAPPRDRYSIAFFLDPNPDALVEVLPSCLAPSAQPKYPPISCADYIQERISATHPA